MEQNKNDYITLEFQMKFQMRNYRLKLDFKQKWLIAVIVPIIMKLVSVWIKGASP